MQVLSWPGTLEFRQLATMLGRRFLRPPQPFVPGLRQIGSVDDHRQPIPITSGIWLSLGRDDHVSGDALVALREALSSAGIPCRKSLHPPELRDKRPNTILIAVGKKE